MNYIENIIKENIKKINEFGVSTIGVFGSYSKDSQTEESDIDILVNFKANQKSFDNYMDLKFFLEDLFGRKIDLVIEESLKKELKEEILRSVHYVEAA